MTSLNQIMCSSSSNSKEEVKMTNLDKVKKVLRNRRNVIYRKRGAYTEATKGQIKLLSKFVCENHFKKDDMGLWEGDLAYEIVNYMHPKELKTFYSELQSLIGYDTAKFDELIQVILDYIEHCYEDVEVIKFTDAIDDFDADESMVVSDFAEVALHYFEELSNAYCNIDTEVYLNTRMAYTVKLILQVLLQNNEDIENSYPEFFGNFTAEMRNTAELYKDVLTGDFGDLFILYHTPDMWSILTRKISECLYRVI